MPKFTAADLIEQLEYDFAPYAKLSGVIKEPTDRQIGEFLGDLKSIVKDASELAEIANVDLEDPGAFLTAMNSLNPDDFVAMLDKVTGIFANLCSGSPSKEQLLKVPVRVRSIWFAWLQGEVLSPEVKTDAGSAQVVSLPRSSVG